MPPCQPQPSLEVGVGPMQGSGGQTVRVLGDQDRGQFPAERTVCGHFACMPVLAEY